MSVSVTPAVGTALQRAAAASTMAVACWLVTDARQRALIDVVVDLAAGPVDRLAQHGGIEEGGSGDVFGSAGEQRGRREKKAEAQKTKR